MLAKFFLRSSCRATRLSAVSFGGLVAAMVMLLVAPLRADTYNWVVPSGNWSDAGNWLGLSNSGGTTLPTSNDAAYVVNGGTATVTQLGATCGTLSLGGSAGSGTVQMTGGNLSATSYEYVGYSGTGTFTQSGGTNTCGISHTLDLDLGYLPGSSGTYNLSGAGLLSAYELFVGSNGRGAFNQTGGTNALDLQLVVTIGTYNLGGTGLLLTPQEYINTAASGFTQSGGTNSVSGELVLRSNSSSSGKYSLGAGQLSAVSEYVGANFPGSSAQFLQTGGSNQASYLSIISGSQYQLAGGTLGITGGFSNQGVFDGTGGGTLMLSSSGGLFDFTQGTFQNCSSLSLNIGANSLLIVPKGFNTSVFGSFSNAGLTHIAGTMLTIVAGQGFAGWGAINDPVTCQGTISTVASGSITLNNGLVLSGTGSVALGTGGRVFVNDTTSAITGGSLTAGYLMIGSSGTGLFTQSGGVANPSWLRVGYYAGSNGTYVFSAPGELKCGAEIIGNFGGTGSFIQSNGTNTTNQLILGYTSGSVETYGTYNLSGGLLSVSNEAIGGQCVGRFTQTGGTNSVTGFQLGAAGAYNLDGGVLSTASLDYVAANSAVLNFSGGTLQAGRGFSTSLPMALGTSGGGATFDTAGFAVTLSGSLSGPGGLTKVDSGTLILATTNTYSGNTLTGGGTLALGNALALQDSTFDTSGSGVLSFGLLTSATLSGLTGPGTLVLSNTASAAVALSVGNNNASTTFSGTLQGPGSLTKIGSGTLLLSGSNTNTGPTTIGQGELVVDGWLTNSAVSVNGGTLGGTGYLRSVAVNAGGHLAPGDLHTGALILAGGVGFQSGELDIVGMGSSITSLSIAGSLSLNGNPTLDVTGSLAAGTYTIASYGGTLSGQFTALNIPAGDTIDYGTRSDSSITLSVVPEPSTFVLLDVGAIGLIAYACRRRTPGKKR